MTYFVIKELSGVANRNVNYNIIFFFWQHGDIVISTVTSRPKYTLEIMVHVMCMHGAHDANVVCVFVDCAR